jgi:hypothetical protein
LLQVPVRLYSESSKLNIVVWRPVARQRPRDQQTEQPFLSNALANKHFCKAAIGNTNRGMVFSVWSVPRCYKQAS